MLNNNKLNKVDFLLGKFVHYKKWKMQSYIGERDKKMVGNNKAEAHKNSIQVDPEEKGTGII